jgi:hypothetical protein
LGAFLGGIATALPTILASAARVVGKFLQGITNQIPGVVAKGAKLIITFLTEITKRVPQFAAAGAKLIISVITGIGNTYDRIIRAGVSVIKRLINGIAQAVPDLVDAGFKAIIRLLNGIERAIRNNSKQMRDAGWGIADAIIDGMVDGLHELWHRAIDWANNAIHQLPKAVRKVLGIGSPSKVFAEIGRYTMMGLEKGLSDNHQPILNTATNIGNRLISTFTDVLQVRSQSKALNEVGKGVVLGFRDGLDGSTNDIHSSFQSLRDKISTEMDIQKSNLKQDGEGAAIALTDSLAKVFDRVNAEIDTDITITPVLDLSRVQQDASKMYEFLQYAAPVTASVSADHASNISTAAESVRVANFVQDVSTPAAPATVHFEQNNYSPDPLSNIEIYRQTNNQMSLFRNKLFLV